MTMNLYLEEYPHIKDTVSLVVNVDPDPCMEAVISVERIPDMIFKFG